MSMRILKGNVKYKDRSDIVCTYGIVDDGTQYYFMDSSDSKKFSNGNRIASTLLVEAVDPMVKTSNIGVIDPEGNVVIPFENKSIRPVNDNVIIVENSNPVTESVIEAINLRSDPLSATKLVSTPATIKERLNQQMGVEGKYLFNDQFSEATICDINGNNLINDERYSFIAMANDKLYFSKNVADSPITEYSLIPSEIQNNVVEGNENQAIDLNQTAVDQSVVENAMENVASEFDNNQQVVSGEATPEVPIVPENNMIQDTPYVPDQNVQAEVPAQGDAVVPEAPVEAEVPAEEAVASEPEVPVQSEITTPGVENSQEGVVAQEGMVSAEAPVEGAVQNDVAPTDMSSDVMSTPVQEGIDIPAAPVEAAVSEPEVPVQSEMTTPGVENSQEGVVAQDGMVTAEAPVEGAVQNDAAPTDMSSDVMSTPVQEGIDIPAAPVEAEVPDQNEMPATDVGVGSVETPLQDESYIGQEVPAEEAAASEAEAPVEAEVPAEEAIAGDVGAPVEAEAPAEEAVAGDAEVPVEARPEDIKDVFNEDANNPENITENVPSDVIEEKQEDVNENTINTELATDSYDKFNTDIKTDKIIDTGDYFNQFNDYSLPNFGGADTIMTDVAKSMGELINQNRVQKGIIGQYKAKIDNYETQIRMMSERYNEQLTKIDSLSNKLREINSTAGRLEAKNQLLEQKARELTNVVSAQEKELRTLRPQLEGKQDLVQLLADAKVLLGSNDSYSYDDDTSYYRRVA